MVAEYFAMQASTVKILVQTTLMNAEIVKQVDTASHEVKLLAPSATLASTRHIRNSNEVQAVNHAHTQATTVLKEHLAL